MLLTAWPPTTNDGMNERGHAVNAVLLGIGIGVLLDPSLTAATGRRIVEVGVPILLGALFPDIDTSFGTHRKTFHNALVLVVFAAFPLYFGNLFYVWLGILTHYVLDLLGNVKGMAVLYPHSELYDVPVGVNVNSRWADVVTVAVTGFELLLAWFVVSEIPNEVLAAPPIPGVLA
jgi:hypothetical protein